MRAPGRRPTWADPGGQPLPGCGADGTPPRGFFGALFDFGFNSYATPVVIKVLYILGLVGIGLGYVGLVVSGFAQTPVVRLSSSC